MDMPALDDTDDYLDRTKKTIFVFHPWFKDAKEELLNESDLDNHLSVHDKQDAFTVDHKRWNDADYLHKRLVWAIPRKRKMWRYAIPLNDKAV